MHLAVFVPSCVLSHPCYSIHLQSWWERNDQEAPWFKLQSRGFTFSLPSLWCLYVRTRLLTERLTSENSIVDGHPDDARVIA